MSRTFAALRTRNFRLFATGSLISNVGTWMQRVAQDWLVLVLTGSGGALGLTTGLQFLPSLILSPLAGLVADRYAKRRVLAAAQTAMGATAAALGLLAVTGTVTVWHVYVLSFLFGVASAFDLPARQVFVNEMVDREQVANAVALNSSGFNLARMVGPAISGLLISAMGSGVRATGWVILINAASYVAVLVSLQRMRASELTPAKAASATRGQIREGLAYIRQRPDLMLVMAVAFCIGTFGLNFQVTIALMATDVYGRGAGEYGLLGSILAVGSLAGSLVAARRASWRQRLVVVGAVVFGVVEALAGLMPSYFAFAVSLPWCGALSMTVVAGMHTFVQMNTDAEMRGRVMAIYFSIFLGGTPVGSPLLGWVSDHAGARWTLIGGGLLTSIGAVLATVVFGRRQGIDLGAARAEIAAVRTGRTAAP